ncbi:conserved hypothetical protein [Luminiphilus syltensis NOR5-1B]|uniref:Putative hydro-lyase NOR51B_1801 n=1 Tax=Luminiphilus syltensis NOR5-1B TaxID=565045 RepID=B8KSD3_9GAMM|nr:putative hydro-lyase [Luminiphilus syltensis]EED35854.1 conserved hypothetical protein [Luminiphilus syltensis NOR5-1B]
MKDHCPDTGAAARADIRQGLWRKPTSGIAPGFVQCNLVILDTGAASDFLRFCQTNPKPCPLLAMSPEPGDPTLPALGASIDVRTDCPSYRIWTQGALTTECDNLLDHWQSDHVAFALGCSFSFEEALIAAGVEVRHITEGVNVPMYRTHLPCESSGVFRGTMVVSMRPMKPAQAIRAIQICARFPTVHGAPIHFGQPEAIGINDLTAPDFGEAVSIREGEVPVFWACGVTPQVALENAKLPLAFTHTPGHMLITDLRNAELAVN